MDEAGRAPEPPLIVAPPGLEMDPEVKTRNAVTENEAMSEDASTSNGAVSHHNGAAAGESSRRVPLPADEIGNKKGSAHLVTESDAASNGSAAEPKDSDGRADGRASTASGVLDSGRQAVKQAMAATTNWFSPSAKSGASDSDEAATAPRHAAPAVPGGSIMAPPPSSFRLRRPGPFGLRARRASAYLHRDVYRHIRWHCKGWHCNGWHCVVASGYGDAACPGRGARPAHAVHVLSADGPRRCVVAMAGGASASGAAITPRPRSVPQRQAPARPGQALREAAPGVRPSGPGPGTGASSPGGYGFSAAGAAAAVGGAAAGLASSVTSAFQGRTRR